MTIRRSDDGVETSTSQMERERVEGEDQEGDDLADPRDQENLVTSTDAWPLETVKVEISTPADFKNTYYEIATIKSPYTFQVSGILFGHQGI